MGKRWGRADFQALKDLERRLSKLEQADFDRFCRETANEIANRLMAKVKKNTPTGVVPNYATEEAKRQYWSGYTGGTLKRAWTILPIEKQGNNYVVTLVNNMEYASYVEYGHRQQPGRYVPALGKSLKKNWTPGRFMLTVSEQELEAQLPGLLRQKLYTLLKEVF